MMEHQSVGALFFEKIYIIRNQKVMLDRDLSELYGVETKRINEQVRRNITRFPEDFMFRLTKEETANLRSHYATSSWGGSRTLPYVFTEHGILMLSSVLSSEKAVQANILIMRVFVKIRSMFLDFSDIRVEMEKIKSRLENQGKNIDLVFAYLDELIDKKAEADKRPTIGYKK